MNGAGATDAANFAPATFRTPDDPAEIADGSEEASLWLTYLSGNHTGADVPIYSMGAGSEKLEGSIDNTDLFDVVTDALGVSSDGPGDGTGTDDGTTVDVVLDAVGPHETRVVFAIRATTGLSIAEAKALVASTTGVILDDVSPAVAEAVAAALRAVGATVTIS